jgi:two-component system, response regulator
VTASTRRHASRDEGAILLVEDQADDIALTRRVLQQHNVANEVVVARDGSEALDYLFGTGRYAGRDPRAVPRLVLLDLHLPRVNGLEVLKQLRADPRTRLLPVVILTSSAEDQDRVSGYELGANSYIRKPVDFAQFVEATQQLCMYWLVCNEPPPLPRTG